MIDIDIKKVRKNIYKDQVSVNALARQAGSSVIDYTDHTKLAVHKAMDVLHVDIKILFQK